jgi:hypothetical protein
MQTNGPSFNGQPGTLLPRSAFARCFLSGVLEHSGACGDCANGDAHRLRTAEVFIWNGKALAAPRAEFDQLLARDELRRPGVYILACTDPKSGRPIVHIGESSDVAEGIRECQHLKFWTDAYVFVSSNDNLTKAQLRYLRYRVIEEIKRRNCFVLYSEPPAKVVLDEAQRPCVEEFFSRIRQILTVVGSEVLFVDAF